MKELLKSNQLTFEYRPDRFRKPVRSVFDYEIRILVSTFNFHPIRL